MDVPLLDSRISSVNTDEKLFKKDLSRKSNSTDLVTITQGRHFMERPSMYFEILFRNVEVALK